MEAYFKGGFKISLGADWLMRGILQKIVLVISSVTSKEVLERWTFDIQTDDDAASGRLDITLLPITCSAHYNSTSTQI